MSFLFQWSKVDCFCLCAHFGHFLWILLFRFHLLFEIVSVLFTTRARDKYIEFKKMLESFLRHYFSHLYLMSWLVVSLFIGCLTKYREICAKQAEKSNQNTDSHTAKQKFRISIKCNLNYIQTALRKRINQKQHTNRVHGAPFALAKLTAARSAQVRALKVLTIKMKTEH